MHEDLIPGYGLDSFTQPEIVPRPAEPEDAVAPEPGHRFSKLRAGINKMLGIEETSGSAAPSERLHEDGSTGSTERSTEGFQAETAAGFHETSHASSYAGGSASGSAGLPPLPTTRIGDKTRVVNGKAEWSPEDFGHAFLQWFANTFPDDWGTWVWFPDIKKHYFPRFRAGAGARHLQLGSFIRGLGRVTQTRPMQYVDRTGRRRSTSEYWMGELQ